MVAFYRSSDSTKNSNWTHCWIVHDSEAAGIVPVIHESETVAVVSFQDVVFRNAPLPDIDVRLWQRGPMQAVVGTSSPSCTFRPLHYPTQLPLSFYTTWRGHKNLDAVAHATATYGANQTVLQLPNFAELVAEQVVQPFFLFQVFCCVLWSLDEYWYYALFTLFALLMFESTLAYTRLQSLQRLHLAGHAGNDRVWVRRGGGVGAIWVVIPTRELVPGDLVSLSTTNHDHQPVPADIVVVGGSAVVDEAMLTGESIPQLKHALDVSDSNLYLDMQDSLHKESILFGGTVLLVSTPEERASSTVPDSIVRPDDGVLGIVLKTGFETAQGSLLRSMAHSSKSADGLHTWDTFFFIFLLLCCAVGAAAYVLKEGWYDWRRNHFRLVLHVVIIVTSVVPPELPMELSLAVTNSVADLMKRCQVYCTEHFRIPWAGQVNVCCFDKTGTLTSDLFDLRGVRVIDSNSAGDEKEEDDCLILPNEADLPWESLRVMAACHSLALAHTRKGNRSGKISVVGDPLEQTVLKHTGFRLVGTNQVSMSEVSDGKAKSVTILHRFAFSSKLKRMTVIVEEEGGQGSIWALTKGAPETIKELLSSQSLPVNYDDVAFHHMNHGRRVLAMAYRNAGTVHDLVSIKDGGRATVEMDLLFAGFLVLDCPLKPDSKTVIKELQKSGHNCVMITGDAILTAVEVAQQVGIVPRSKTRQPKLYRIQERSNGDGLACSETLELFEAVPLTAANGPTKAETLSIATISKFIPTVESGDTAFCISGDTLVQMAMLAVQRHATFAPSSMRTKAMDEKHLLLNTVAQQVLTELVPLVSVFARHAPHQKEAVVAAFNHGGFQTLMCGDGTNDVGALKRAHVGISIVSAPGVEAKQREAQNSIRNEQKRERKAKKGKSSAKKRTGMAESLRQLREAQDELDHVELGDASVAAPFTSRAVSIKCCKDVIQQGRCTLVTMLQIYKILGINCLVNAMVLSRLFLYGVKQGDRQLTILGVVIAGLFYFVTRAEPLPILSATRPPASVLCSEALLSIAGQFVIHVLAILAATEAALSFVDPYDPSLVPDGPFNPNALNSCTFLLTCLSTVNTFAVNYRGHPFMQHLHENKLLYRSLQLCYAVLAVCALEVFPPLSDLMQLSALPTVADLSSDTESYFVDLVRLIDFPVFLTGVMVVDTALAFAWERFIVRSFLDKR
jgi:manganese-transporting P-type ATPase